MIGRESAVELVPGRRFAATAATTDETIVCDGARKLLKV
jgi:hypothetical protein